MLRTIIKPASSIPLKRTLATHATVPFFPTEPKQPSIVSTLPGPKSVAASAEVSVKLY